MDRPVNDSKYTTYLDIYAKLTRVHSHRNIQMADVVEWCAECEIDWLRDPERLVPYAEVNLPVVNFQAQLPCNLYRLLDVYWKPKYHTSRVKHYNDGIYINFSSDYTYDFIYIDYEGIAIDPSTNFPLIKKGHEQACEAFCVWKIYYEDFLNGTLDPNRWMYIDSQKNIQIDASRTGYRHYDRARLDKMSLIISNMVPKLNSMPLTKDMP